MTGYPVFRTFLAALCLAGLSALLFRLTAADPAIIAGPATITNVQTPVPMRLRVRCTQPPISLTLLSDQQILLDWKSPASSLYEGETSVPIPPEGLEIVLTATWPEGALKDQAITVELEPDNRAAQAQTAWTEPDDPTQLTAYLSYQWK